jgi:hypothetical protein
VLFDLQVSSNGVLCLVNCTHKNRSRTNADFGPSQTLTMKSLRHYYDSICEKIAIEMCDSNTRGEITRALIFQSTC